MELIEYFLIIFANLILISLTLIKKGGIFAIIGIIINLFTIPFLLKDGLVLSRAYTPTETTIYANPTFPLLILAVVIIIQAIIVLRVMK